jgi:CBS domain-containing protein
MEIGAVCQRNVVTIDKAASIFDAARIMRNHHIGDLVVVDGKKPIGMITDRDIVVEIVAKEVDLASVAVGDVMSLSIATAEEDADLFETLRFMGVKGVRRLPVLDTDGALVGILSVRDAMQVLVKELNFLTDVATRQVERERRTRA